MSDIHRKWSGRWEGTPHSCEGVVGYAWWVKPRPWPYNVRIWFEPDGRLVVSQRGFGRQVIHVEEMQ